MLNRAIIASVAGLALMSFAHAASPEDDATFLKTAIGIDLAEIDAGNLAQKNGGSMPSPHGGALRAMEAQ